MIRIKGALPVVKRFFGIWRWKVEVFREQPGDETV